jgi:transcriptional regulator with XRE-family HTH domain
MNLTLARDGFPNLLRHWRSVRRISQLELALIAEVSARHISFLESGRAKPSRNMVALLADALDVPLAERNALLGAAGFAPAYQARPPGDRALALPEAALAWMLDRHAPYPGLALDRHWRLVRVNAPAERLLGAAGVAVGDSLLAACGPDGKLRPFIENWPEVARYMAARLQTEIEHHGGDPVLAGHRDAMLVGLKRPMPDPTSAILPVVYRMGDVRLSFFSTIAHFGGAADIALDDLRIELMFPADERTADAMTGAAPQVAPDDFAQGLH